MGGYKNEDKKFKPSNLEVSYDVVPGPSTEYQSGLRYRCNKIVGRKLPIVKWLPKYRFNYLLPDIIAGFTVWMTAIPASMGDAAIAGVSPEYGLYSAYIGAFIYVVLGSCRELVIGPQAVISLLSFQACGNDNPECVILLGFYSGVVHMLMGILHLGFLVSFIPEPVTAGFTAGAALLIATGQVTGFLGLKSKASGTNLVTIWGKIIDQISMARWEDSLLGVSSVIVLVTLYKLKDIKSLQRWKKQLHIVSLSRNALVMIISTFIGYMVYDEAAEHPALILTGTVRDGFPDIQLTEFRLFNPDDLGKNATASGDIERMSYVDTLKFLGSAPIVMALIEILQNVAISKRFSDGTEPIDATQEMISLGVVNMVGSGFFEAIPTSASFSRSAVNASSGAKSHLSGLFAGLLMVMSLALFTPTFKYIPKASLASIIIAAMIFMIDFATLKKIWIMSKFEFLVSVCTFLAAILLGMEYGIIVGVGLSMCLLLLKTLRPPIRAEYRVDKGTKLKYIFVRTDQGLNFPSVDHLRDKMTILLKSRTTTEATGLIDSSPSIVVLDCTMWTRWDFTSVNAIAAFVESLQKREKSVLFYNLEPAWVSLLANNGFKNCKTCKDDEELAITISEINRTVIRPRSISVIQRNLANLQDKDKLDAPYGFTVP